VVILLSARTPEPAEGERVELVEWIRRKKKEGERLIWRQWRTRCRWDEGMGDELGWW